MIDSETLSILHDIIRRESLSFGHYVGDSLPWPQNDGVEVEHVIAPMVAEQNAALGELYRFLTKHRLPMPYFGSYPSAFTTRNFISLHGLLPLLVQEERELVAALGRDAGAIKDAEASRLVGRLFEIKRAHLRRLEELLNARVKHPLQANVQLIDTHAHLDDERFSADLSQVLERAEAAGVIRTIAIATTATSSHACVELAAKHPSVSATVGIQPNHVAEAGLGDWDEVARLATQAKVVAIGETGLDRHWDFTPFSLQEDYFARHLELARRSNLAVVIHCRKAEADVVRMLREAFDAHGPVRGVMHSFTGDLATARACLEMGLYLSFAGMLTYKNADDLREVARQMPVDRLLVETDSPYLAPVPVRGQRNEPAHVVHTLNCLAGLVGMTPDALATHTTENSRRLFGI